MESGCTWGVEVLGAVREGKVHSRSPEYSETQAYPEYAGGPGGQEYLGTLGKGSFGGG